MIQTRNKCLWLKLGHISHSDKPCANEYCGNHMQSIKHGSTGPKPSVQCGIGARGKTQFCVKCGGKKYRELKRYYDKKYLVR
jgi:hypothetical protein